MTQVRQILVTGAGGMLASALVEVAPDRGCTVRAYPQQELDITDEVGVRAVFAAFSRQVVRAGARGAIVNAAAYTDVEGAESDPETAYRVNEFGARATAAAARDEGLDMVHVSTDFVFDGERTGPYLEDDSPAPLNVYGASKLAGERAVAAAHPAALIVRTAWVFGPPGPNFPLKILDLAGRLARLQVVTDEIGSPTYTVDLATGILALLEAGARGLYHLTAAGSCSRYELALETLRLAGLAVPVEPVAADPFFSKARRPRNSVLDCGKAAQLGVGLPDWRDGLARYVGSLRG